MKQFATLAFALIAGFMLTENVQAQDREQVPYFGKQFGNTGKWDYQNAHGKGYFVKTSTWYPNWTEVTTTPNVRYHFIEIARTPDAIFLYDASRKLTVILTKNMAYFSASYSNGISPLIRGQFDNTVTY